MPPWEAKCPACGQIVTGWGERDVTNALRAHVCRDKGDGTDEG
jgi:hypothetical protein